MILAGGVVGHVFFLLKELVFCFVVFLFLSTLKQAERTEVCACAQRQRRERERESKKSDENMGGRKRMIKKGTSFFSFPQLFVVFFFNSEASARAKKKEKNFRFGSHTHSHPSPSRALSCPLLLLATRVSLRLRHHTIEP